MLHLGTLSINLCTTNLHLLTLIRSQLSWIGVRIFFLAVEDISYSIHFDFRSLDFFVQIQSEEVSDNSCAAWKKWHYNQTAEKYIQSLIFFVRLQPNSHSYLLRQNDFSKRGFFSWNWKVHQWSLICDFFFSWDLTVVILQV